MDGLFHRSAPGAPPAVQDAAVRRARRPLTLAGLVPAALLGVMFLVPLLNPTLKLEQFHMLLVLAAAAFTGVVTVWMGLVGVRQRNTEVILLSLAFASLGMVYMVHGLGTPEVGLAHGAAGHGAFAVLPASAQLAALLAALWLLLSSLPSTNPFVRSLVALRGGVVFVWLAALVGLAFLTFRPEVAAVLAPEGWSGRLLILGVTVALCAWAMARYWTSWRYTRFPLQLAVVYAGLWLSLAQALIVLNFTWTLTWWVYHVLLVLVSASLLSGLILQYRASNVPLGTALRGLWNNEPDALLAAGISRPVQALVADVEAHDPYTAGHAYRVTLYALKLARALGCGPEALRAITQGGILHDLGKLDVPADVLNFPGKLGEADWAQVQRHPVSGYERARHLGLLPEELQIVRHHHERWDGAGYPDRLAGEGIPMLARILAVADVYDALTSERAYRQPWSQARANGFLQEEAGKAFDGRIVAAWVALCEQEAAEQAQEGAAERQPIPLKVRPTGAFGQ